MKYAQRLWVVGIAGLLIGLLTGCTPANQTSGAPADGVADAAHSSQNSLDWAGSYKGTLPCADCPGIETVVTLYNDGRYDSQRRYMERSDEIYRDSGNFTWDSGGGVVTFTRASGVPSFPPTYR